MLLLLATAVQAAQGASGYGYARRLHASGYGAGYPARRLAGAAVQPALLPGSAPRLFGAWEPHHVPIPTRLASASSRSLAGYYAVSACTAWGLLAAGYGAGPPTAQRTGRLGLKRLRARPACLCLCSPHTSC